MTIYVFCQGFNVKPSGGTKVLFDTVSTLVENGKDCKLLIPGGNFSVEWFDHNKIDVVSDIDKVTNNDFVMFHEETLWAFDRIVSKGCKYGILNQGAHWSLTNYLGYPRTKKIYHGAEFVLVNSYYTGKLVSKLFDIYNWKVLTLAVSDNFRPDLKQNRICYMSRRNSETAECVAQFIRDKYAGEWETYLINDLHFNDVAKVMSTSKVFLSFGGPEGFGLPPLEAAISGCKVIGYDGFGGAEFFCEPLFLKIPFMEIIPFIDIIDIEINAIKDSNALDDRCELQRKYLQETYSMKNFKNDIIKTFSDIK